MNQQIEKLPETNFNNAIKTNIATDLLKSQCFDQFLAKKFTSLKRYGGEGCESMMVFFNEVFKLSAGGKIYYLFYALAFSTRSFSFT